MAYRPLRSAVRTPLTDKNRIEKGLARAERMLHREGTATPLSHVQPIRNISVHGLWDGIVGHPVDVKISLTVCLDTMAHSFECS